MTKNKVKINEAKNLEQIIAERTADLLKKKKELQQEIAELRKAEENLEKSERGFRLLM